jgi:hypothetical protein
VVGDRVPRGIYYSHKGGCLNGLDNFWRIRCRADSLRSLSNKATLTSCSYYHKIFHGGPEFSEPPFLLLKKGFAPWSPNVRLSAFPRRHTTIPGRRFLIV